MLPTRHSPRPLPPAAGAARGPLRSALLALAALPLSARPSAAEAPPPAPTAAAAVVSSSSAPVAVAAPPPADRRAAAALAPTAARASAFPAASFGVNVPLSWRYGGGYGGSLSVGVSRHFAVRANVASYPYKGLLSESDYDGRIGDVSLGLVYYPRRLWSGFTVELAALGRDQDTAVSDSYAEIYSKEIDTRLYAARALIGWSWSAQPFFFALAVGASVGYETGHQTITEDEVDGMSVTSRVSGRGGNFEGYLRMGLAFGR